MGWIALGLIGAGAAGLAVFLGLARPLWTFVGAALMLGAAGYALQGRPMEASSPAQPFQAPAADDPGLIELRDRLFGRFSLDGAYLIAADAMHNAGDDRAAVQVLLGGIRKLPRSLALWTGLGTAMAAHDKGQMSPPALFAFRHAIQMAPEHPAPPFFLGLAYVRSGDFAKARQPWARAVALSPPGAAYRRDMEVRLDLLDQFLAMQGQAAPAR